VIPPHRRLGLVLSIFAISTLACSEPEPLNVGDPASSPSSPDETAPDRSNPAQGSKPSRYAGSAKCIGCHPEEGARWRGSHHDLAMREASPETVLGDFEGKTHDHFGVRSSFERDGERYLVRTEGPDGGIHEYEVAYTFGSHPLQQYLAALPDGRLQALALAWDSREKEQGGQRWFHLQPDEPVPPSDVLHWTGRAMTWNSMCAECHSTGIERGYDLATHSWDTKWAEVNVACEACHGPASEHVAWAQSPEGRSGTGPTRGLALRLEEPARFAFEAGSPIARRVGPGAADRRALEVCAPCHSRRSRLVESAEVGSAFHDAFELAILRPGLYHPDGQPEDEVYVYGSFLQSKMYRAGVTCGHCHDPHGLSIEDPDAVCAQCHQPAVFDAPSHHHHPVGSAGASCIGCHMSATTYMEIDERRDHSFRVPRPDLSISIGTPNACNGCHPEQSAAWSASALARWQADRARAEPHFGEALYAGWMGLPGANAALAALALDPDEPAIARAGAIEVLGRFPEPALVPLLEGALEDDDPLVRAAAARAAEALPARESVRLLVPRLDDPLRSVRLPAARSLSAVPPELVPQSARKALARGFDEYEAAQRANAERPEAHVNLGSLLTRMGAGSQAREAYSKALERGPEFVPASVNFADLLRRLDQESEAERVLRRALVHVPESPELHHALGLLLIRTGRRVEARAELERAAELGSDRPRILYTYGVALEDAGRRAEAIPFYERAHRAHPGDAEALLALATAAREEGQLELARKAARRLAALHPDEPAIRHLLQTLGLE